MRPQHLKWFVFIALMLALVACSTPPSKPTVKLTTISGQIRAGQELTIPVTATDAKGVVRIEFLVDNKFVAEANFNPPEKSVNVPVKWVALVGDHTIAARAFNADNIASEMDTMIVAVSAPAPTAASTAGPTLAPPPTQSPSTPTPGPARCANNAAFIADVTVPDGTNFQPNQTFNKIWRVQNAGSCTWNTTYQMVFVNGERMTTLSQVAVTGNVAPGQTYDVLVALTAPASAGAHTGHWQLRDDHGALFGPVLVVKINTLSTTPPQATIQSPANGFQFMTGVPVRITYKGNAGTELTSVALYINGAQVAKQTSRTPSRQITGYFDWNPAAGNYDVYAVATDVSGQQGASAHVAGSIIAPAPCQASINFRADRTTINFNEHTTLRWDVECVKAVYINGQGAPGHGSQDVSPNATTTYTLRAVKNDNSTEDRNVTIVVNQPVQPTPIPARRNASGNWVSGNYALDLSEALGCPGPSCGVQGRYIESHGVASPVIESVQGSINVNTGALSLVIARPGAQGISCTIAANNASMVCTGSFGTLTFTK